MRVLLVALAMMFTASFAQAATTMVACSASDKTTQTTMTVDGGDAFLDFQYKNEAGAMEKAHFDMSVMATLPFTDIELGLEMKAKLLEFGITDFKTGTQYALALKGGEGATVYIQVYNQVDGGAGMLIATDSGLVFIGSSQSCK